MRGLTGKVAVVAGGATGIGRGTAIRLGEEGARVVVGDLDGLTAETVAREIVEAGGEAIAVGFDIATEEGVDALVSAAVSGYGGVDCVHVNAADTSSEVVGRDTDLEEIPLDVFDRTLAVNLRGHVLVTRRAVPELLARGGGAIVYTGSGAAFRAHAVRPAYSISKSGQLALVRHVASRWGREGIRANVVVPGAVQTEKIAASASAATEETRRYALSVTPSTRLGRPSDIAAMVAFLFSDDGEWINGQSLAVDGGQSMR